MERSSKESWLNGGDLREADVENVPVPGMSVRVRGLSAKYAAAMQGQIKIETQGREQVAKVDAAAMEPSSFTESSSRRSPRPRPSRCRSGSARRSKR